MYGGRRRRKFGALWKKKKRAITLCRRYYVAPRCSTKTDSCKFGLFPAKTACFEETFFTNWRLWLRRPCSSGIVNSIPGGAALCFSPYPAVSSSIFVGVEREENLTRQECWGQSKQSRPLISVHRLDASSQKHWLAIPFGNTPTSSRRTPMSANSTSSKFSFGAVQEAYFSARPPLVPPRHLRTMNWNQKLGQGDELYVSSGIQQGRSKTSQDATPVMSGQWQRGQAKSVPCLFTFSLWFSRCAVWCVPRDLWHVIR